MADTPFQSELHRLSVLAMYSQLNWIATAHVGNCIRALSFTPIN